MTGTGHGVPSISRPRSATEAASVKAAIWAASWLLPLALPSVDARPLAAEQSLPGIARRALAGFFAGDGLDATCGAQLLHDLHDLKIHGIGF